MVALMANDIDNISMLLGDIRGSLRALESKVDTNNNRAEQSSAKVMATLEEQDERLDELAEGSRLMRTELTGLTTTVTDSKMVTDDVKRWRVMGVGAISVVGIGGAWMGANGAWLLDVSLGWIKTRMGL